MWAERNTGRMMPGVLGAALLLGLVTAALGQQPGTTRPIPSAQASESVAQAPLIVRETAVNLQVAFQNEMNANQRYVVFAKQAEREGYPKVARLFRACAVAEKAHADRLVEAIGVAGGEAKAVLEKVSVGTTAENLQRAIDTEAYEVSQFYPAMRERARADHQSAGVRSTTYALSAEREHLALLTAAQAQLEQRAVAGTIYVCPCCGKTIESLDFSKCPNCFTRAGLFTKVT